MEQQKPANPEKLKQHIIVQLEKLKFIQHFFLPLISGLAALNIAHEQLETTLLVSADLAGIFILILLYLLRNKVLRNVIANVEKF